MRASGTFIEDNQNPTRPISHSKALKFRKSRARLHAMIALADFKREIKEKPLVELADRLLLADGAKFVSKEEIDLISESISRAYGLDRRDLKIVITGSAKLGFSIIEKRDKDGTLKPRFRPYTGLSDIDVAVVSKVLFERLWRELSYFASNSSFFPLNHKKLGPYLVSGWLRPDHFPVSALLPDCKKWSPIFWDLSRHPKLGRRQIRGGLFYSSDNLRHYQVRGLRDCLSGIKS